MKKLSIDFYRRNDVLLIARDLLGKILVTRFDNIETSGRIVEVEAYNGIVDKASHSFGGRRTKRTEVMYADGGVAYVYLCYGIHHLFNVVTNVKDVPHAILIRAVEPLIGINVMMQRRKKQKPDFTLTRGPGSVAQALGLQIQHTGSSLTSSNIIIADDGFTYSNKQVVASPRIGVDYAGDDALLPYRFFIKDNKYASGKNK